ncbi:substrate-binding domain-containing protein [Micrococcales bacterium 31B]|nr:substrate-binding domain-containing protein [Micrococcales bacterium 31B]
MISNPASTRRLVAAGFALVVLAGSLTACSRGSDAASGSDATGSAAASGPVCTEALAAAKTAVAQASDANAAWDGPTEGPTAATGKTVVYVAQSMQNPGVAGAANGFKAAAEAIGWNVQVIDGGGTPSGIQAAFGQALALKPSGIALGGFDPSTTSAQVTQANAANIPLVGWQISSTPGPMESPKIFANVTTKVEDVAAISAQWVIAHSEGTAQVVVFTDKSIPFAAGKSDMIEQGLKACSSVKILSTENVPLADVTARMPQTVDSLLSKYPDWNYSVAINDVYFENAAASLRGAGKKGDGAPFNIGAGDGDPSALQRVRSKSFEAASVPSPLLSEGWQMVDELNRAFNNAPASGYVPQVHLTTADNVGAEDSWDPTGYEAAYRKIWGK